MDFSFPAEMYEIVGLLPKEEFLKRRKKELLRIIFNSYDFPRVGDWYNRQNGKTTDYLLEAIYCKYQGQVVCYYYNYLWDVRYVKQMAVRYEDKYLNYLIKNNIKFKIGEVIMASNKASELKGWKIDKFIYDDQI